MADIRMRGFSQRTTVHQFEALIREHCRPLGTEEVSIAQAGRRVLAEPVVSGVDVPGFERSAMDGYALRSEETFGAGTYNPLQFRVIGEVTPGRTFPGRVGPGETVRIMTGAPLPDGADAVLMAEYAAERDGVMTASDAVTPRKNVGRIGEDIRAGSTVLPAGRVLRPQDLGVLASIGQGRVRVVRRCGVALLITGNELLRPGERPQGARIVDSNSIMLAQLIARDGAQLAATLHLADIRDDIRAALSDAPGDLLVTTGGTSVGIEDHAPTLIAELGELLVHGVAMRPSAPSGFGLVKGRPVFLLPGNPVSCLAAYDFFVRLGVNLLGGRPEPWPYRPVRCTLTSRIASQIGRVDYARVRVRDGQAELVATSGASILSSTSQADGFVVVEEDSEGIPAGGEAQVWLYD
ncbi:MAG: molybdopterin molybdotransferase MoeA [Candidatus Lambdaproteobacteria bacterium]|nr:molybdopterin molybdotransferase MoeA [Candidatus Lambdaproteobacteria bacterium]